MRPRPRADALTVVTESKSVSKVPAFEELPKETSDGGGGDRLLGGNISVPPDGLDHQGTSGTQLTPPSKLTVAKQTETPTGKMSKLKDDLLSVASKGAAQRGTSKEGEKRRRKDTFGTDDEGEEERLSSTPSKRARVMKEGGEMSNVKKKGMVQLQLSRMMLMKKDMPGEVEPKLRRGRGDSTKKRKRRKEEEWNKVVADSQPIQNFFKPKPKLMTEGGTGERSGLMDTAVHTDTEEERRRSKDKVYSRGQAQKQRILSGIKVSKAIDNINLYAMKDDEVLRCDDGPGDRTRDTAVYAVPDDDEGGDEGGLSTRENGNKEDICYSTAQSKIHVRGGEKILKVTDTNDSDLARLDRRLDGPDRK